MRKDGKDVNGGSCMKDKDGRLVVSGKDRGKLWKDYYQIHSKSTKTKLLIFTFLDMGKQVTNTTQKFKNYFRKCLLFF